MTSGTSYFSGLQNVEEGNEADRKETLIRQSTTPQGVVLYREMTGLPVGLRHMMTGVPDTGLSTLRDGLKMDEDVMEGWLAWGRRAQTHLTWRRET